MTKMLRILAGTDLSDLAHLAHKYDCQLELRPQADPPMGSPWEVWEHETGYVAGGEDPAGAVEGARRWLERCGGAPAKVRSWLDKRGIEHSRADDGSIWVATRLHLWHSPGSGWHWFCGRNDTGQLPAEGWEDALAELLRTKL